MKSLTNHFHILLIKTLNHKGIRRLLIPFLKRKKIIQDKTVELRKRVHFDCPTKVHIGSMSMINSNVNFYTGFWNDSFVTIGDNVKIGFGTSLITVTHEIGPLNRRGGECLAKSIIIGDGVWIGANVTVLPGVSIANGCVIGAGAVVTKNTEPNGLYVGVPARRIKDLNNE